MRKVGIFGCTADPFTIAHLEIVKQALKQGLVDVVYVCPTIVTWHRKGYEPWLDDDQKLEVIRGMLKSDPLTYGRAMVYDNDLALRKTCVSSRFLTDKYVKDRRFIDTLLAIKAARDLDDELWPIIGPDEYRNFESWYAYDSVLMLSAGLLIVMDENGNGRDGKPVYAKDDDPLFKSVKPLKIAKKFMDVSATKARDEFRALGWKTYLESALAEISGKDRDETLLHTPIFDVKRGPDTGNGLRPILVDAPDWASVVVEKDAKFLVVRQRRYGAGRDITEFPCGMVENGESPLDAAVRELEEETGIKVLDRSAVVKMGEVNPNPAFMTNTMHYFYVNLDKVNRKETGRRLDEHESIDVLWKDKDRFTFDVADDAHCSDGRCVPAMLLAAIKLYENMTNYPGCA